MIAMLTPPIGAEYAALLPGGFVALVALCVILFDVFHRKETSRDYLAYLSAIGLMGGVMCCYVLWGDTANEPTFHGMLYLDKFSLFFAALSCIIGAFAVLVSPGYIRAHHMDRGEFYMLILFAVVGMIFMACAADLLAIFIALEVMSIPIYALAAYLRKDRRSAEAGMKYFILGAFSATLFLWGIAFVYGLTGTTNLEFIGMALSGILENPAAATASEKLLMFAIFLIASGFGFKIAAVPFHVWTPDVYTGAPTPAVGFMATGVKAAAFAAMIRTFVSAFYADAFRGGFFGVGWLDMLLVFAVFSMILGNAVAITQSNVKRMLAYSSIAHAGYLLLGFVAANAQPEFFLHNDTVLFYLLTYALGTLGAFGVLSYLGKKGRSAETYEDLAGTGIKYPWLGAVMAICMFSSAGIPPTAGFLGKFYLFRAAVNVGSSTGEFVFIAAAIVGVLTSVAGVFYYLRVLVFMYMKPYEGQVAERPQTGAKVALIVLALGTLYLGIFPNQAIGVCQQAVLDFRGAPPAVERVLVEIRKNAAGERSKAKKAVVKTDAAKPAAKPAVAKPAQPTRKVVPPVRPKLPSKLPFPIKKPN